MIVSWLIALPASKSRTIAWERSRRVKAPCGLKVGATRPYQNRSDCNHDISPQ